MKMALIQDQLLTKSGSERVFYHITQEFKEADCFTFAYNSDTTWPDYKNVRINVHPLGKLIRNHSHFKTVFPVATYLMERWDLKNYDVILSSSATISKYVKNHSAIHVCYCYYPTRAIWDSGRYFKNDNGLSARFFRHSLKYFKSQDKIAARRVDKFVAISETTRTAIKKFYQRDSTVLFSPVDTKVFNGAVTSCKDSYYLIVSRLEKWKLLEYAVDAFNFLGLQLKIVGAGPEERSLRSRANKNIEFVGSISDNELGSYYARATAVVFTPELEYGLVPIEALAAGTPVIALGRGGVLETLGENGINQIGNRIGVLFKNPCIEDLVGAVGHFRTLKFDQKQLIAHASRFSVKEFQQKIRGIVNLQIDERERGRVNFR